MKLTDLLHYSSIVIQVHNDPDADALASGYGLYLYFKAHEKNVRLIYGGSRPIRKSNLLQMMVLLDIPIEHVRELSETPDLLLMADCRYGEHNAQKFSAPAVAVIDHHPGCDPRVMTPLYEIRTYGACATIVWDMLGEAGFRVSDHEKLATALYYGLFMDTGKMQEIAHPKDKDMRDALEFKLNQAVMTLLQCCNISKEELKIAAGAMANVVYQEEHQFALAEAGRCDPNILGIISDALIEVDTVNICMAYCILGEGIKLSVRSCGRETLASDFVSFIVDGIGTGGGHERKAGGYISLELLRETYKTECRPEKEDSPGNMAHELLMKRAKTYFLEQDMIYSASDTAPDLTGYPVYEKLRQPIGYVQAKDLFEPGTRVKIRTLEGDLSYTIREDTYFIIGVEGEIYKNDAAYFLSHNDPVDEPYEIRGEYAPSVHAAVEVLGTREPLPPKILQDYVKACIPKAGSRINARELSRRTKVFVPWSSNYMLGNPGDFLVARVENPKKQYIIRKDIMEESYRKVTENS